MPRVLSGVSGAVRSPAQARATMLLIVAVLVVGQFSNVLGWYALSNPWHGLGTYLREVAPWLMLPVSSTGMAIPFLVAPRRWWGLASLVAASFFAVVSTLVNLFLLNSATLAAQLMSVIGAFFAGYHFRRRAAYISLVVGIIGHAILVWGVLPKEIAIGDMIFMDLFLTTMVVALVRVRDEQERAHLELHRQATTDSLTGLATRSVLHEELVAQVAGGRPGALVLVDVDRFKLINDTYGHPAGDAALLEIANRMRALGDGSHVLARLGGDEFAVLIRDTSQAAATAWAECLSRAVAEQPLQWLEPGKTPTDAVRIPLSVSVGVAGSGSASSAEQVYAAADRAMYVTKRTRDRNGIPQPSRPVAAESGPSHSRYVPHGRLPGAATLPTPVPTWRSGQTGSVLNRLWFRHECADDQTCLDT